MYHPKYDDCQAKMNQLRQSHLILTKADIVSDISGYRKRIESAERKLAELKTIRKLKWQTRKTAEAKLLTEIKLCRQCVQYALDALSILEKDDYGHKDQNHQNS